MDKYTRLLGEAYARLVSLQEMVIGAGDVGYNMELLLISLHHVPFCSELTEMYIQLQLQLRRKLFTEEEARGFQHGVKKLEWDKGAWKYLMSLKRLGYKWGGAFSRYLFSYLGPSKEDDEQCNDELYGSPYQLYPAEHCQAQLVPFSSDPFLPEPSLPYLSPQILSTELPPDLEDTQGNQVPLNTVSEDMPLVDTVSEVTRTEDITPVDTIVQSKVTHWFGDMTLDSGDMSTPSPPVPSDSWVRELQVPNKDLMEFEPSPTNPDLPTPAVLEPTALASTPNCKEIEQNLPEPLVPSPVVRPDPKVLAIANLHSDGDSSTDSVIEETEILVEFEVDQELEWDDNPTSTELIGWLDCSDPLEWLVDEDSGVYLEDSNAYLMPFEVPSLAMHYYYLTPSSLPDACCSSGRQETVEFVTSSPFKEEKEDKPYTPEVPESPICPLGTKAKEPKLSLIQTASHLAIHSDFLTGKFPKFPDWKPSRFCQKILFSFQKPIIERVFGSRVRRFGKGEKDDISTKPKCKGSAVKNLDRFLGH